MSILLVLPLFKFLETTALLEVRVLLWYDLKSEENFLAPWKLQEIRLLNALKMNEAMHFWDNIDALSVQIRSSLEELSGLDDDSVSRHTETEQTSDKR